MGKGGYKLITIIVPLLLQEWQTKTTTSPNYMHQHISPKMAISVYNSTERGSFTGNQFLESSLMEANWYQFG